MKQHQCSPKMNTKRGKEENFNKILIEHLQCQKKTKQNPFDAQPQEVSII
jgi:hypothetical protein